jgi:hypothetical protein
MLEKIVAKTPSKVEDRKLVRMSVLEGFAIAVPITGTSPIFTTSDLSSLEDDVGSRVVKSTACLSILKCRKFELESKGELRF